MVLHFTMDVGFVFVALCVLLLARQVQALCGLLLAVLGEDDSGPEGDEDEEFPASAIPWKYHGENPAPPPEC